MRAQETDGTEIPTAREDISSRKAREDTELSQDLRHRRPPPQGREQTIKERLGLRSLIGQSPAFLAAKDQIAQVAQYDVSVLILGETGTGKELFARAIHYLSARSQQPFIPVNCGAIPADLFENELFGHDRGAFTGAVAATVGLIREADGGTLFLDEIDALPVLAQVKLLRFLQEKEYRPLGSTKMQHVDLRVVAATNVSIEQEVKEGKFRQDLYYRLNIIPMTLPRLCERKEDIPILARHFLLKYAGEFKKTVTAFSAVAMRQLLLYAWPGNVRELEHIVQRAVVLSQQEIISEEALRLPEVSPSQCLSFKEAKASAVAQFERSYLLELLGAHQGSVTQAARTAQKHRRALWQLIYKALRVIVWVNFGHFRAPVACTSGSSTADTLRRAAHRRAVG
ncbi:MAG: sigma-54-dependent Fis family transcriptional regulator [Deltaproteobacteria bacterium]|nr:sigma-54-dependent Fis family transcriptional regulator [Deltaproteobacteria bacterium]